MSDLLQRLALVTDDELIDLIYGKVDELLCSGKFGDVDAQLTSIPVDSLQVVHLIGLVSITYAARDKLPSWSAFVARVRAHLEVVEPTRVDRLLDGFVLSPEEEPIMSLADAVQKLLNEGLKPGDEVPLGFSEVTDYRSSELKSMDQELTEALEESAPEEDTSNLAELEKALEGIRASYASAFKAAPTEPALREELSKILGRNGSLTSITMQLQGLSPDNRATVGEIVNDLSRQVSSLFQLQLSKFQEDVPIVWLPPVWVYRRAKVVNERGEIEIVKRVQNGESAEDSIIVLTQGVDTPWEVEVTGAEFMQKYTQLPEDPSEQINDDEMDPAVIVCSSLEEMVASVKEHIAATGEAVRSLDIPSQGVGVKAVGGKHWLTRLTTLKETTGPLRVVFQTAHGRYKFCKALNEVPEKHDFGGVLGLVLGTSALLALSLKPTTNPRVHEEASPEAEAEATSEVESEAVQVKSC